MSGDVEFHVARTAVPGVTVVRANTIKAFQRHTHDEFGIGTIDEGAQVSASGRGAVEAARGDVITVNPNEVHDGFPIGSGRRAWRMLYLPPHIVTPIIREISRNQAIEAEIGYPVLRRPSARAAFEALYLVATLPETSSVAHWEERLLALLAELVDRDVAKSTPALPSAIAHVRHRIDADPAESASLEELALGTGISRFDLVRGFTNYVGLPPHAYRVQRRIHLARRLILTGMPLVQAAMTAGFADQSHMTRALKRSYGLTPAAFARA